MEIVYVNYMILATLQKLNTRKEATLIKSRCSRLMLLGIGDLPASRISLWQVSARGWDGSYIKIGYIGRGDNHGFNHRSGDRASTHKRPGYTPIREWRNGLEVKRTCTLLQFSDVACRGGSPALAQCNRSFIQGVL
jgi:hypothetical protein